MSEKQKRIPGPDHPITVGAHMGRIVVRLGGKIIADTSRALALKEANYPVTYYIPRDDAGMTINRTALDFAAAARALGRAARRRGLVAPRPGRVGRHVGDVEQRAAHRGSGRRDLTQHYRCLGDAETAAAILLGNRYAEPTAIGERVVELPRECVSLVMIGPVLIREGARQRSRRDRDGGSPASVRPAGGADRRRQVLRARPRAHPL